MEIIKSVQRGVGTTSSTSIIINEVDPNKSIVLINGIVTSSGPYGTSVQDGNGTWRSGVYTTSNGGATVDSLTSTNLNMSNIKNAFSWQVIEFY